MPPRKKGPDMGFLAALMKEYTGEDVKAEDLADYETISNRKASESEQRLLESEGLLKMLHHKHSMLFKICRYCKRQFTTNYCYQECCSESCREDEFRSKYGITLRELKVKPTSSFWEYEPVLSIATGTLEALYEFSQWVIDNYEGLKERSLEEDQRKAEQSLEESDDPGQSFQDAEPAQEEPTLDTFSLDFPSIDDVPQSEKTENTPPSPSQFDPFDLDSDEFVFSPFQ
jgi:hypothetical protein